MENKIDIAELLKDCPKGMELGCSVFEDVTLYKIDTDIENEFPIRIKTKNDYFLDLTKYGTYANVEEAKCVIFPKGKTTWKGFVPPCKFKDGDILTTDLGSIFVLKEPSEKECYYSCYIALNDVSRIVKSYTHFCIKEGCRLATEEEKEKLFQAIKADGYKWNAETKTLEKLTEPKFHEGQWITDGHVGGQITSIEDNYPCYKIADFMGGINTSIPFTLQDNYHLWTIQDAKDGDVLAAYECLVLFKKLDGLNIKCYCTYHFINNLRFYVDTLQNKDAFHPATEEEKAKLFQAIEDNGYKWDNETKTLEKLPKFKEGNNIREKDNKSVTFTISYIDDSCYYCDDYVICNICDQDNWELVPNKFDITTLKPFDKVLVKTNVHHPVWSIDFYGGYDSKVGGSFTPFAVTGDKYFQQCIPYEENKHLRGTTNDCDDFYKTWE